MAMPPIAFSIRTTTLILRSTILFFFLLSILLGIYYGSRDPSWLNNYAWMLVVAGFIYLAATQILLHKRQLFVINWMLILFYISLAFCILLGRGINAPLGILCISFAVILPVLLLNPRSIIPVAGLSIIMLFLVQFLHNTGVPSLTLQNPSLESTYWDAAIHSTILSILALISWVAGTQYEKNLLRALDAEVALQQRAVDLAAKLDEESATLRHAQMDQIHHLHKFAVLGQSTAATLHELSNHLSVLNLDIDNLKQQHRNSKAISNAEEGIDHINEMVRQARKQLTSYENVEQFSVHTIVNQSLDDLLSKFELHNVKLVKKIRLNSDHTVLGSPFALAQIITILLNNAFDACKDNQDPCVIIEVRQLNSKLTISVLDNGGGIHPTMVDSLFNPITSKKPTGLGVGLFIAQNLAKDQFDASISLKPNVSGAHFIVEIPKTST